MLTAREQYLQRLVDANERVREKAREVVRIDTRKLRLGAVLLIGDLAKALKDFDDAMNAGMERKP